MPFDKKLLGKVLAEARGQIKNNGLTTEGALERALQLFFKHDSLDTRGPYYSAARRILLKEQQERETARAEKKQEAVIGGAAAESLEELVKEEPSRPSADWRLGASGDLFRHYGGSSR